MKYDELTGYHTESVLVLPLLDREKNVLGVMQLINAVQFKKVVPFSYDVQKIIYSLSSLSGVLLNNMSLYQEIKDLLYSFVKAMVKTIESRTPYNASHTANVAKLCNDFVDYLNLKNYDEIKPSEKEELVMAAMLHDIGKIIIKEDTLNKATRFASLLPLMNERYDLISLDLDNKYLNNSLNKEEYEKELNYINKIKEFVNRIENITFLNDDDLKFIEEIKNKEYNTKFGIKKIFEEKELECAYIKKGTLKPGEKAKD